MSKERLEKSISVIRNLVKKIGSKQGLEKELTNHSEYLIQQAEEKIQLEERVKELEEIEKNNLKHIDQLSNDLAHKYNNVERYEQVIQKLKETHEKFCEDDKQIDWTSGFGAAIDFIEDNLIVDEALQGGNTNE